MLWRSTSHGPVVLVPGRDDPERIGGMAAVVWELLDHPVALGDLDAEADALLGSRTGVAEALVELVEAGLVVPISGG